MAFGTEQELSIIIRAKNDTAKAFNEVQAQTKQLAQKMTDVGKTLTTRVTAPIALIGGLSVKAANDFQSSMNRVQGLTGSTGEAFAGLEKQAKMLGATTQFSAKEAADGMGFLAMAGFDTTKIMGAMPGVLQLAASAQLDLASAADITSNILTGYGMKTEELSRVNDVLVKTFSSANTDLVQLGEAMKYAGPVAAAAGLQFEEVAAATGLMGNAGIQASMAGTSLRGAISRLLNPTKEVRDGLASVGLTIGDLTNGDGSIKSLTGIIGELEGAGADAGAMMKIFGLRAGPAFTSLVEQGSESLADFTKMLEESGGTAERIAKTQMQGLPGALKELTSVTEGARIALGEALAPAVMKVAQVFKGLMASFIELPDSTKKVIVVVGLLAAAAGPLLIIFGTFLALLPLVAAGFAILTGPVGLVIAAVVGLGIAMFVMWDKIKAVWSKTKSVWQSTTQALTDALDTLASFWNTTWETIQSTTRAAIDGLIEMAKSFWETFDQAIVGITGALVGLFLPKMLMAAWTTIAQLTTIAIQSTIQLGIAGAQWVAMAAKAVAQSLIIAARAVPTVLAGLASMGLAMAGAAIAWGAQWIAMAAASTAQAVRMAAAWIIALGPVAWITAAIVALAALIFYNWDAIKAKSLEIWSAVSASLTEAWAGMKNAWATTLTAMAALFGQAWEGMKGVGKAAANFMIDMAEGIANTWVKAVNTIVTALNKIHFSVPDWVPGIGGNSWGINIPKASEIKLPRFEFGGIVPGAKGTAVPIMAHGQERIIPAGSRGGQGGGDIYIQISSVNARNEDEVRRFKQMMEDALRPILQDNKLQTT